MSGRLVVVGKLPEVLVAVVDGDVGAGVSLPQLQRVVLSACSDAEGILWLAIGHKGRQPGTHEAVQNGTRHGAPANEREMGVTPGRRNEVHCGKMGTRRCLRVGCWGRVVSKSGCTGHKYQRLYDAGGEDTSYSPEPEGNTLTDLAKLGLAVWRFCVNVVSHLHVDLMDGCTACV
jgi:hypothetical protein